MTKTVDERIANCGENTRRTNLGKLDLYALHSRFCASIVIPEIKTNPTKDFVKFFISNFLLYSLISLPGVLIPPIISSILNEGSIFSFMSISHLFVFAANFFFSAGLSFVLFDDFIMNCSKPARNIQKIGKVKSFIMYANIVASAYVFVLSMLHAVDFKGSGDCEAIRANVRFFSMCNLLFSLSFCTAHTTIAMFYIDRKRIKRMFSNWIKSRK